MNDIAIRADNLGKRYRIGHKLDKRQRITETILSTLKAPVQRIKELGRPIPEEELIWALRNVSFEVKRGQVLGIIGRNGAGKSTLLKILSRITKPTEGRARIRGRVGSLLEVGTGFHLELTGRENIYLNGTILGMRKAEVDRKFDEIVAFSGVEKFIDTPAKHYSSGMRVRLAFAVAAHLDPEILLIDEVLAVGDAAFQKKCLGKMENVASEGRTVLFVSHDMGAVMSLCSRAILLENGRIAAAGSVNEVVQGYRASLERITSVPLEERTDRRGNGDLRMTSLRLSGPGAEGELVSGEPARFEIRYRAGRQGIEDVTLTLTVVDLFGNRLFSCANAFTNMQPANWPEEGALLCSVPRLPLAPGEYRLHLEASVSRRLADQVREAQRFRVLEGDFWGTGRLPTRSEHGPLLVEQEWELLSRN